MNSGKTYHLLQPVDIEAVARSIDSPSLRDNNRSFTLDVCEVISEKEYGAPEQLKCTSMSLTRHPGLKVLITGTIVAEPLTFSLLPLSYANTGCFGILTTADSSETETELVDDENEDGKLFGNIRRAYRLFIKPLLPSK